MSISYANWKLAAAQSFNADLSKRCSGIRNQASQFEHGCLARSSGLNGWKVMFNVSFIAHKYCRIKYGWYNVSKDLMHWTSCKSCKKTLASYFLRMQGLLLNWKPYRNGEENHHFFAHIKHSLFFVPSTFRGRVWSWMDKKEEEA